MIFSLIRYAGAAALLSAMAACASHKYEERLTSVEAQVKGQYFLDMRLSHLEEKIIVVEEEIGALKSEESRKKGKSRSSGRQTEVKDTRADTSAVPPQVAEASVLPQQLVSPQQSVSPLSVAGQPKIIDPAPSLERVFGKDYTSQPGYAATQGASHSPVPDPSSETSSAMDSPNAARAGVPQQQPALPLSAETSPAASQSSAPQPDQSARSAATHEAKQQGGDTETQTPQQSPATSSADFSGAPRAVSPEPAMRAGLPQQASAASQPRQTTGKAEYDKAYAAFTNKQYAEAQKLFSAFAAAHPTHSLTANALYWIGECLYSTGKYSESVVAFQEVVAKFPQHPKAAAALLKAGYAYDRLGDKDNARFYWEILLEDFPSSAPAALARKRLDTL